MRGSRWRSLFACRQRFDPRHNICNNFVALVVVEEEVEAFGIELSGGSGGFRKVGEEGFDIFGVGKDILAAVEDDDGDVEFLGDLL